MRFNLRSLFVGMTVMCVLLAIARWLFEAISGPVLSKSELQSLSIGMTRHEVLELLGIPADVYSNNNPKYDSPCETWYYKRAFNPGWVELKFDRDHYLSGFNDKSVFPSEVLAPPLP